MIEPHDLEIGKIYFEIFFEDSRLSLPTIQTYTYNGGSSDGERYEFKVVGKKEIYCAKSDDLEQLMNLDDLLTALISIKERNSSLF